MVRGHKISYQTGSWLSGMLSESAVTATSRAFSDIEQASRAARSTRTLGIDGKKCRSTVNS